MFMDEHPLTHRRRPVWKPARLSRYLSRIAPYGRTIEDLAILLGLFFVGHYLYREVVVKDFVIIEAFSVPKRFEEIGLTPQATRDGSQKPWVVTGKQSK